MSLKCSPGLQKLSFNTYNTASALDVSHTMLAPFTDLRVIKLPRLKDIQTMLQVICGNNPLLEEVSLYGISEDVADKCFKLLSRLKNLQSLEIVNNKCDRGISPQQLTSFVASNQTEERLRFSFTLQQKEHFPGNMNSLSGETDWSGILWRFHFDS